MADFITLAMSASIFVTCFTVFFSASKRIAAGGSTFVAAGISFALSLLNACVNGNDPLRWAMICATAFMLFLAIFARTE